MRVRTSDRYSDDEIIDLDLVTFVNVWDMEPVSQELPILDIGNYGLEVKRPQAGDTVSSFPYEVKIGEYARSGFLNEPPLTDRDYHLYFIDLNDERFNVNSAVKFTGDTFLFDGLLRNGEYLDENAYWYVSANYVQDGYSMSINTWGNAVYCGWDKSSFCLEEKDLIKSSAPFYIYD